MHFAPVCYTLKAFFNRKSLRRLQYEESITPWPTVYNLSDSASYPAHSRLSEWKEFLKKPRSLCKGRPTLIIGTLPTIWAITDSHAGTRMPAYCVSPITDSHGVQEGPHIASSPLTDSHRGRRRLEHCYNELPWGYKKARTLCHVMVTKFKLCSTSVSHTLALW
jgi:hypothetical protein